MPSETDELRSRPVLRTSRGVRQGSSSSRAIPLFVIDDNPLLRGGIVARVDAHPDVRVVDAVDSAEVALSRIRETRPRVLLVDAAVVGNDSRRFLERVRESAPEVRIIVKDLLPAQADVAEFVKAGASGFIMKGATTEEVIDAVRSVAAGEEVLPFELMGTLLTQIANHAVTRRPAPEVGRAARMTKREREVVDLIAEGLSNKEIARHLHVGTPTVKSHVHNILDKLSLHTRLEIASFDRGEREARERRANVA